jgi:hypothetical protein
MLIAVACTVDSRFSAVTTISSNPPVGSVGEAAPAADTCFDPASAKAHTSAPISDVRIPFPAIDAYNMMVMSESP